jgi:hypothetical protein
MRKVFLIVLALASMLFAVPPNGDEYPANARTTFEYYKYIVGTNTYYSPAFNITDYENLLVTTAANDTINAGLSADTIAYKYGLQYGYLTTNYSGTQDTEWCPVVIGIDSVYKINTAGAANVNSALTWRSIDSTGSYSELMGRVDTVYCTSLFVQSHNVTTLWYPIARFVITGITGHTSGSAVWARFSIIRRVSQNVWQRTN